MACPPFASLHRSDLNETQKQQWNSLYQQGVQNELKYRYDKALEYYLAVAEIDSHFADLHFRMGKCHWMKGDYTQARQEYIKARETDTLRFRADTKINEVIRSLAQDKSEKDIYLVDSIATFEKNSPHAIPGSELFWEHVHLKFRGNYLLARAIFQQIEIILPERVTKTKSGAALLTEQACAEHLAYTGWDHAYLKSEYEKNVERMDPDSDEQA